MRDRQTYNFLAALIRQVHGAVDDGDDLAADLSDTLLEIAIIAELHERIGDLEQWLASLDPGMEDNVQEDSDSPQASAERHPGLNEDQDVASVGPLVDRSGGRLPSQPTPACVPTRRESGQGTGRARRPAVASSRGTAKTTTKTRKR